MLEDLKDLFKEAKHYYEVKRDILKIKTAESLSASLGNVVAYGILAFVAVFILLFFSVTLALGIGWLLSNNFWGFLIVTGLYVAIAIFIYFRKQQVIRIPILNSILKSLFKNEKSGHGTGEGNRAA